MAMRLTNNGPVITCDECGDQDDVRETWVVEKDVDGATVDMEALPVDMCAGCRALYVADNFDVVTTNKDEE